MSAEEINHYQIARSRVATQYTESAKFLATLSALCGMAQELETALLQVRDITDIDNARGVQLDIIGDIVGVSRLIPNAILLPFFGFADGAGSVTFGEEGVPGTGARFRDEDEASTATTSLGDPEYRLIIRAKIVKNHATGTNDDILRGMEYLFQGTDNAIEDLGGMKIRIGIGRELTLIEKILIKDLDLLARPAGVQIAGLVSYESDSYLGFSDQPNAKGFAEEGSSVGGILAEEF